MEAIKCYDEAIKLKPNCTFAYYNKGNAFDGLGRTLGHEQRTVAALLIALSAEKA